MSGRLRTLLWGDKFAYFVLVIEEGLYKFDVQNVKIVAL